MAWAAPAQAQEVDLLDFFSGRLTGSGEFRALDGNNRTIQATYRGVVSGGILTLTSNLVFSDGEKQTVAWTFTRNPAGGYVARRREVDGPVNVATSGNRFSMSYQATVKAKDGQTYKLSFDETYTRTGPRTLSNSTQVTYFLLPLGTSSMTITKAAN
ncbi:MAG: putative lipoprotein [Enterovirga sp.]|nr:putative lipoprotein [Enterovirga sp.]